LGTVEDVSTVTPAGEDDHDDWVESQDREFQDAPQVVVTFVRLVLDQGKSYIKLRRETYQDETGEEIDQRFSHFSVVWDTKTGNAKPLKAML
jgi:hypothetical protein